MPRLSAVDLRVPLAHVAHAQILFASLRIESVQATDSGWDSETGLLDAKLVAGAGELAWTPWWAVVKV